MHLKREKFCYNYAVNTELFNHATFSYADAFGIGLDSLSKEPVTKEVWDEKKGVSTTVIVEKSPYDKKYHVCAVEAHKLLKMPEIDARIRELFIENMNDELVDSELMFVVKQRKDLKAKNSAISEYNKVKQRVLNKVKVEGLSLRDLYLSAVEKEKQNDKK